MIYRIKQFMWAISSNFKEINYDYICRFLNHEEIELFYKLKNSEKHHCVRVCTHCLNIKENKKINIDEKVLGKLALLHDIGKTQYKLNLIEKVILVILHKITKGELRKLDKFKGINIYYNHGIRGRKILEMNNSKYDYDFLDAIEHHHYYDMNNNITHSNILLTILMEADNKS